MAIDNKYTKLEELDRRILLAKIGTYCHESDTFYEEVLHLIEQYENSSKAKVGLEQIIPQQK